MTSTSFFVNGLPLAGSAAAFVGSAASAGSVDTSNYIAASLAVAAQGVDGALHPSLAKGIDAFVSDNSGANGMFGQGSAWMGNPVQFFGSTDLWVGRKKEDVTWEQLDGITRHIFAGDPHALESLQQVLDVGHIAEMKMAVESHVAIDFLDAGKRNRALLRLRSLELAFDEWRKSPEEVSAQERMDRINPYVHFAGAMGMDFRAKFSQRGPLIKLLFDLVQLHEFIRDRSGLLEKFSEDLFPAYLTELLCGEIGSFPLPGICHPLAVLALHLGKRIGLPLRSYFSEGHVSLFVDFGSGFIYEPQNNQGIFLSPEAYVKALCAPEQEKPRDPALLVLTFPGDGSFYGSDEGRACHYQKFLTRHVDADLWVEWLLLSATFGRLGNMAKALSSVEEGLRLFPNSFPLLIKHIALLIRTEQDEEAERVFRIAKTIVQIRLQRGILAAPAESDMRLLQKYSKVFNRG